MNKNHMGIIYGPGIDSENRISNLIASWSDINDCDRPGILAEAISASDAVSRHRDWIVRQLYTYGPVFDSEDAEKQYKDFDERITIYRGGVMAEENDYHGLSWTLDEDIAMFFARDHFRFFNSESQPIVFEKEISKSKVLGFLTERHESEILYDSVSHQKMMREIENVESKY